VTCTTDPATGVPIVPAKSVIIVTLLCDPAAAFSAPRLIKDDHELRAHRIASMFLQVAE
jgi:hypothetical protein